MNVRDLKSIIEDLDDDVEVRIASQPQWAFEYDCEAAVTDPAGCLSVVRDERDDDGVAWWIVDESEDPGDDEYWVEGPFEESMAASQALELKSKNHTPIVYIAEGTQLGYLPREARRAVSW